MVPHQREAVPDAIHHTIRDQHDLGDIHRAGHQQERCAGRESRPSQCAWDPCLPWGVPVLGTHMDLSGMPLTGLLDIKELVDCVQAIRGEETLNTELLEEYARRIDSDGNGQLSLHEFTSYLGTCYLLEPPEDTNPLFIEMVSGPYLALLVARRNGAAPAPSSPIPLTGMPHRTRCC